MRHSTRVMAGLIAAGALAALGLSGGARAQDVPGRSLKIVVVNMSDCMEPAKNDHARDLEAQFNSISREAKEELARIRKKADDLKAQVKNLEESGTGSALYLKLASEWNLEEARFDIINKMSRTQLVAARDAFRAQMYSEARKVITLMAQEQKIDLVLRADDGAFEEDKSDLSAQKNMLRSVLYHDPALDITAKVLTRLNEEYRKKKPSEYECPKCKIKSKEPKCPKCGDALKN